MSDCPRPMMVQTLIFKKSLFTLGDVRAWLAEKGFSAARVEEMGASYRARQHDPKLFVKNSFRTIVMGRGQSDVRAVIGCPRMSLWAQIEAGRAERKRLKAEAAARGERLPPLRPSRPKLSPAWTKLASARRRSERRERAIERGLPGAGKAALPAPRTPAALERQSPNRPLYFAYGSNMDEAQMSARVPGSKLLGRAWLKGYEFLFSGYSQTWGGAVANVRKKPRGKVFGVIYALPPGGLSKLSRFEGPRYQLRTALVDLIPPLRGRLSVSLYLQRQTAAEAPPSPAYTAVILKALRRHRAP